MDQRIQRLNRKLAGRRLGLPLLWFDTVGSTNDLLKEKAQAGAPEGCVIIADGQTRGRGRRGKEWLSLAGKGVYMSVLLRPRWAAPEASFISMLAVVAVAQALEKIGVKHLSVKWPNDILARGKKISGILVEPRISRKLIDFAVVGIGINVGHRRRDLRPLDHAAATSCRLEGVRTDCDRVIIHVLKELESCYDRVHQNQTASIMDEWSRRSTDS